MTFWRVRGLQTQKVSTVFCVLIIETLNKKNENFILADAFFKDLSNAL